MKMDQRGKGFITARQMIAAGVGILLILALAFIFNRACDHRAMEGAQQAYMQHIDECAWNKTDAACHLYMENEDHIVAIKNGTLSEKAFCTQRAALQWLFDDPATPRDESMSFATAETGTEHLLACVTAMIHISFDDVECCFRNLTESTSYSSLYDEPFFGWLKELHDLYGAKFSLYTYANVLQDVPDTYREEFFAASDWLKIGFHADHAAIYGNWDYDSAKVAWNNFADHVYRITGTYDSVDRMPRLHYFAGSEAALRGMRDANVGALGFLSADDSRVPYYFDESVAAYLYTHDWVIDESNGLVFLTTDMRGDWFGKDFSSANQYRKPKCATVFEELEYRYGSDSYARGICSYIFFSHEWKIYDGVNLNAGTQWVEDVCRFAYEHGIEIGYPQDRNFGAGKSAD